MLGYNIDVLLPSVGKQGDFSQFSWSNGDAFSWLKVSLLILALNCKYKLDKMFHIVMCDTSHLFTPGTC